MVIFFWRTIHDIAGIPFQNGTLNTNPISVQSKQQGSAQTTFSNTTFSGISFRKRKARQASRISISVFTRRAERKKPTCQQVYAPKHGVDEKKSSLALLDYF